MESGRIRDLLLGTGRTGMDNLVAYMEEYGFFKAPCSTSHHLSKEGGLAEHSLNVLNVALSLGVAWDTANTISEDSIIICSLLLTSERWDSSTSQIMYLTC